MKKILFVTFYIFTVLFARAQYFSESYMFEENYENQFSKMSDLSNYSQINNNDTLMNYDSIGNYYYNLGDYAKAIINYELFFKEFDKPYNTNIEEKYANAKNCDTLQQKALEYLYAEEYDLAEKEILKVLEINPNARNTIIVASAINPLYSMVLVRGGMFMMGSETGLDDEFPVHKVELNTFEISRYEITNLQYSVFLNEYRKDSINEDYEPEKKFITEHEWGVFLDTIADKWKPQKGYEFYPVVNVSWFGAIEYCNFYNLQLVSEAQWEFAAGRGQNFSSTKNQEEIIILQKYAGTNSEDELSQYSWYLKSIRDTSTYEVGLKKPIGLGIYDLNGNAEEWCADMFSIFYYRYCYELELVRNPISESPSTERTIRGGNILTDADSLSVKFRSYSSPRTKSGTISFRVGLLPFESQNRSNLIKTDAKYALIDENNKVISDYFDAIYDFNELWVAVVRNKTKFGAINKSGEIVVPIQFSSTELALELEKYIQKYMIDNANTIDVYLYKGNKAIAVNEAVSLYNNAIELDPYKPELLIFVGDKIKSRNEVKSLEYYKKANEIKKGSVNIQEKYEFVNGIAAIKNKADKYSVIDTNGIFITTKWYDNWTNKSDIMIGLQKGDNWLLMNNQGDILIKYVYLYEFSEGLAFIQKKEDGPWGAINQNGKVMIRYKFDEVISPFEDGKARVMNKKRYFYIDKEGNEVN